MSSEPQTSKKSLSPEARRALKSVFLILFIDLIGFSIIFPLFPALLTYYVEREGQGGFLGAFLTLIHRFQILAGGENLLFSKVPIVLFGGFLGALYSLFQFLFAPVWGALSDRYGRKPILLISLTGIALSYLGWFFAGSFLLLVLSRILSGIMGGNISTATAAVSDVTTERERSAGMAVIGIAFGLGFVVGPAIGGLLAHWSLLHFFPMLERWGINPFSLPAAFAFLLTAGNILYLLLRFRETLPKEKRGQARERRTINPLAILETRRYPGTTLTILSYFFFLIIFSGMEFSLTFLAAERLGFRPVDNGMMFVFGGVVLAAVQGGYVRRQAHQVGEKRMALWGIALTAPGLLLVGFSHQALMLYMGLFFLSVGAALTTPCLTSLVSLYTPVVEQGHVIGIFRSMGALARAIGPLIACTLYWRLQPTMAYFIGSIGLLLPLALGWQLPPKQARMTSASLAVEK